MRNFVGIILFLFCSVLNAQELSFTAEVDTNKILIGEQIKLTLTAELPEGTNFLWPTFTDPAGIFEATDSAKIDTIAKDSKWFISQELTLTAFDSGYYAIPPIQLNIDSSLISSEAIGIAIGYPEFEDDVDLYDIKKPMEVPVNWWPTILIVSGGLILALALFFIARSIRAKNIPEMEAPKMLRPAHIEAFRRLQKLENDQLWQKGEIKKYYSRLIDILRHYMERLYSVQAMESTAEEIIDILSRKSLPSSHFNQLKDVLRTSSLVKFAKVKPSGSENEEAINLIKQFIELTKPQEKENKADNDVDGSI